MLKALNLEPGDRWASEFRIELQSPVEVLQGLGGLLLLEEDP